MKNFFDETLPKAQLTEEKSVFAKSTANMNPTPEEERSTLVNDQEIPKIVKTIEPPPERSKGASSPQQ